MKATQDFSQATPSETRDLAFDFDQDLAVDETVSSATFTLEVAETDAGVTADASPSTRKSGSASIDEGEVSGINSVASQRVVGLQAGNKYRVIARSTTSTGQVLELFAYIWSRTAD